MITYASLAATLPEHLADFRGISRDDALHRMESARDERNRLWIEAAPKTEADRERLYVSLGALDLFKYAAWHRTDVEKQAIHDEAVDLARRRRLSVLDCGGGIGDTALAFAANGVAVTYVDFAGVCSDFARFRWEKHGCLERVRRLSPGEFWKDPGLFDVLMSIDVLEHLENPVRHAVRYRDLLRDGGHLFVTAHFRHGPRNPDHLPENDAYHRVFGGERRTARRSALANLGFRRRRWYHYLLERERSTSS